MFAFAFTPKTDEEINALRNKDLLADGQYPFIVKEATHEVSKTGNPMLKVRLGVLASDGERNITDWLMATDTMIFKLKHFCESIGMLEDYANGSIKPEKCINRSGIVTIGRQKGQQKEDGTYYRDKNSVKDYVPANLTGEKKSVENDEPFNDDINF